MGVWNLNGRFLSKSPTTVFSDTFENFTGWVSVNNGSLTQSSAQAYEGSFSALRETTGAPAGVTKLLNFSVGRDFIIEYFGYHVSAGMRLGVINSSGNGYGMIIGSGNPSTDRYDAYTATILTNSTQTTYTRQSGKWYKGVIMSLPDNTFLTRVIDPLTNSIESEGISVADTTYTGGFDRVFISGAIGNYYDNVVVKRLN